MINNRLDSKLIEISQKHFKFIIEKNIAQILDVYKNSDELLVFVEGPRWATLGYDNVSKGWLDFVNSAIELQKCEWIENPTSKIIGDAGFVAGIVELSVKINEQIRVIKFRGTFIFERNSQGDWKIVHEHFSQPAENPYGIGDWLKKD